jgi:Uma2 family endonuclease
MAAPTTIRPFTVKEYLALEAVAEMKHEFSAGRILAMAGADLGHNTIVHNLHLVLGNALAETRCRTLGADQRVVVEAVSEYFYPDLVVTCLEPKLAGPNPPSLTNPQVIVEVLSESTERYDRGDKWSAYRQIPSLTDYLMVSSMRREVEHYQRGPDGSWTSRVVGGDAVCVLANGVQLDLEALYRHVELRR